MFNLKALFTAAICSSVLLTALASPHAAGRDLMPRQFVPGANTSALPPGWPATGGFCWADFTERDFLLGPSFISAEMTIEMCVDFCDQQKNRIAGLEEGDECHCGNTFNPDTGFESDPPGECDIPCAGNAAELCGATFRLVLFTKDDGLCNLRGGHFSLTSGAWRLSYFYNDTVGARALPHNAVDLRPPLVRGSLTVEACVNACGAAGYKLAGVEYADECYCGNELENFSRPILGCEPDEGTMPCKGNSGEYCGGPDLLYVYTLPGTDLVPLIPFDSEYDGI